MQEGGGFSCEVTGFRSYEQVILGLRNTNREKAETVEYLQWRYKGSPESPEPRVFWLLAPNGQRIGMASVVFRLYLINGLPVQTAVIGDISLNIAWRGRGLGQLLLRFMTRYLDEHFPEQPAFVIPTEGARRALAAVGWVTRGALVPHVFVLDSTRYVRPIVRSRWLATRIARSLRSFARVTIPLLAPREGSLQIKDTLDESLLAFTSKLPLVHGVVHDLAPESLRWRYAHHPHTQFWFATFARAGKTCGFLIFENCSLEQTCSIYDLVAMTAADMRAMISLFILHALATPDLAALRIVLDDQHPSQAQLRRLGFIARPPAAVFQVHSQAGTAECLPWRVTQGDKDT